MNGLFSPFIPISSGKFPPPETDLAHCFTNRERPFQHKLSLNKEYQKRFLYYINKITSARGYAHDIIEQAAFMELMVMINTLSDTNAEPVTDTAYKYSHQVDDILAYIKKKFSASCSTVRGWLIFWLM